MLRLTNICNDDWTLGKYDHSAAVMGDFLRQTGLDGFEWMRWGDGGLDVLPMDRLIGRHLPFWPVWLDFWRGDRQALLRQFGNEQAWQAYYGAATREAYVANLRAELMHAQEQGARYAVFHVSHVVLEHCYTQSYPYADGEIIDAAAELLNQATDGLPLTLALLMENHWYPGLTLRDDAAALRLLGGVRYANKGFVLDVGHLMNTNTSLSSEMEAVDYLHETLDRLSCAGAIRAMHLNCSLTGAYAKSSRGVPPWGADATFEERLTMCFGHVGRLDRHAPFLHPAISSVVKRINPEFLVYELSTATLEELSEKVRAQNRALGIRYHLSP